MGWTTCAIIQTILSGCGNETVWQARMYICAESASQLSLNDTYRLEKLFWITYMQWLWLIDANPTDGQANRKRPAKDDSAILAKRCHLWEHLFHCNIWTQPRVTIQSPNFSHPAAKKVDKLVARGSMCSHTAEDRTNVHKCTQTSKKAKETKTQKDHQQAHSCFKHHRICLCSHSVQALSAINVSAPESCLHCFEYMKDTLQSRCANCGVHFSLKLTIVCFLSQ